MIVGSELPPVGSAVTDGDIEILGWFDGNADTEGL